MTHPVHSLVSASTQRRMGAPVMPRWLFVAGAVALIGVSIDLFRGPPASALPMSAAQPAVPVVLALDHSVVARLADDHTLEPGASVAAYDVPAVTAPTQAPEAAAQPQADGDTPEPGASVAVYDR